MPKWGQILNVNNENIYVTKETWKKYFIILGWAILAVATNPEDIKILPYIKHYSKIFKKCEDKCKMGEIFAVYH